MKYTKIDIINAKLTVAMDHYFELCDDTLVYKYFRGNFRSDYRRLFEFFNVHTSAMIKNKAEKNLELWDVYTIAFDGLLQSKIRVVDDELLHISIMTGMLRSSLKDINSLNRDAFSVTFSEPLRARIAPITNKKYIKKLPLTAEKWKGIVGLIEKLYNEIEY